MKPKVGHLVLYRSYGTSNGEYLSKPRAAIITSVHVAAPGVGQDFVGLCIFNPTGLFFKQAVGYSKEPKPGCWSWPKTDGDKTCLNKKKTD